MANKRNIGLLDKDRFKLLEKEKEEWLKNLSMKKAIALEEALLSSSLIWEWRKNFPPDNPVCFKYLLKKNWAKRLSKKQKTGAYLMHCEVF